MARDLAALLAGARSGVTRDIARLISIVEDGRPEVPELMRAVAPTAGSARVIGITGSPGVGKSTTTSALITALRGRGERVGVLAVDPSSPFSGGALLGDRIRMQQHATDDGVFIRSMASRGHLGGLAATTPQALRVFEAAGFDVVLVETVGVGQSEVEIAAAADTTVVLLAPGMGDGIQAAKAGILEIGDVFVVNKADHDGAQSLVRELRNMIALGTYAPSDWKPPIVRTVASNEEGVDDLIEAIEAHRKHGQATEAWQARRLERAKTEVEALVLGDVRRRFRAKGQTAFEEAAEAVRDGELDPYTAADRILASLR